MENNSDKKNGWLKSNAPPLFGAFILGIVITILFGKTIPYSALPEPIKKIIQFLCPPPPNLNGWYYYVTATDINTHPIQVVCNDDKETAKIAGIIEINHSTMITDSKISFLNGERKYCLPKNLPKNLPEKGNFEALTPKVHWNSEWAIFHDMKIYAYLNLGNDLHSLLNSDISNSLSPEHFSFSGLLIYIPQPQTDKSPFYTTIEFTKCPSKDECEKQLSSKLGI